MGAYVRFCSSQYTAAGLLQKLVEIKPGFDEFLRQCQSGPKIKGMPLSFFLLKVGKSQKATFLVFNSSEKWMKSRVSVQGVKSLGGHFACLCRGF